MSLISEVWLTDNVKFMRTVPDKFYDLAVCDPEYRDKNQPDINLRKKGGLKGWHGMPQYEYFKELFRISKEQIIFGGNYFTDILPPNNNWLIWDKGMADGLHYSMGEMAWVSIRKNVKIFKYRPQGKTKDFHETSKPIALYIYIYETYAEEGWKILDTNLGSGTNRMAAWQKKLNFTGLEIEERYLIDHEKEFRMYMQQFGLVREPLPEEMIKHKVFDLGTFSFELD